MQRVFVADVLVSLLIVFVAGCAILAQPEWSENYALEATSTVPEVIDGSMYSSGRALPPEYIRDQRADDSRYTDIILTFKEPKDIRRIVVRRRSEDSTAVDVNVFAMVNDKWKLVSDSVRGAMKDDIAISVRASTDKIKVRVQRATQTAAGKSSITSGTNRGGRTSRTQIDTILREPIKFAEVEVYGLKPKTEAKES